ncbi:hypothetical protein [Streptomyces sp. NPDC101455]|uniref:hypothetical protein n=1 Tax=Streptomyces sp. NPDC101455 TaxID=3366142 RepID=UPI0038198119
MNQSLAGPDYTRDDVLVSYQWIPQREVSGHEVPDHVLGQAAMDLEGRAWRERQHRVNWREDSLFDSVSRDVPTLENLPDHERETALRQLRKQQRWPWMRPRMRLVRCWVTTHPEQSGTPGS